MYVLTDNVFFQEQKLYTNKTRLDNPPHIFSIADTVYQALVFQQSNQAIVISGESGAGKTESANLLLKQLVHLGKVSKNHFFFPLQIYRNFVRMQYYD